MPGSGGGGTGVGSTAGLGGASGFSGSGIGGADPSPSGGASGAPDCPTQYDLPHYDGDRTGLCAPWESTQCDCPGPLQTNAAQDVECSPDGRACVYFTAQCEGDWECGWLEGNDPRVACPELTMVSENMDATRPCAADSDCSEGHYCSQRVANRMFCDDVVVRRAAELCGNGGAAGVAGSG